MRTPVIAALSLVFLVLGVGCRQTDRSADMGSDQMQAFVRLMTPRSIEIQRFLTKPVSFDGTGDADGVEVILATRDSFGDGVKCVGNFLFELYERRMASGDPLGKRVAFWTTAVDSDEAVMEYWDSLSRFYVFPLKLADRRLTPGDYILTAQLETAAGDKVSDDYEFSHAGMASSATER